MKQRFLCFLLIALLAISLCACNKDPSTGSTDEGYDPTPYVYFFNSDKVPSISSENTSVSASLHNNSSVPILTGSQFTVSDAASTRIGTGVAESTVVESGTAAEISFNLSGISLPETTTCTVSLPCTWTAEDGTKKTFEVLYYFFRQPEQSTEVQPPVTGRDILKTPISDLTADEQEQLAEYLFENYIPCSYGIFSDIKDLSSPSVWSSVEALNRVIDKDESNRSRTLDEVLKKVEIYYPDADFDPEKVRVYDKATKTFYASPAAEEEYVFLSYEVKDGQITIHYEDRPDENDLDTEPIKYATTLKNSATEGYFSFVSSVHTGAVG